MFLSTGEFNDPAIEGAYITWRNGFIHTKEKPSREDFIEAIRPLVAEIDAARSAPALI